MKSLFDELDAHAPQERDKEKRESILRAPFGYPGGKSRSLASILPNLPQRSVYVEAFGGSAAVLLARSPSKLEVLNDRYAGVTSFYRCIRDKAKMEKMIAWLEMTVHSREEFVLCRDTWEDVNDDVERAARWFYMTQVSFACLGRNFGRSTSPAANTCGKIRNALSEFPRLHLRLKNVQIENQSWERILADYDGHDVVFYLDPPYVDTNRGTYKHEMSIEEHRDLCHAIFGLKGFVALSGYSNPLYENQPWDHRFEWEVTVSSKAMAFTEENAKADLSIVSKRERATEVLWIKEAQ